MDESRLRGKLALDAGCGAGRFAEVALSLGAEVVAIDYSSAVDAAWRNLGGHPRLHVVQADIYFAPETFDSVYSLGVLQHTPDINRAARQQRFFALVRRAAPPLLRVSRAVSRLPLGGRFLRRLVPVASYAGVYPPSEPQLVEWAILDTFHWLAPRFDHPQSAVTGRAWLEEAGLSEIEVGHIRHLTARAIERGSA